MWLSRDIPIRRRLTLMTLMTTGFALILACTAFFGYDVLQFRKQMANDLYATGRMVAGNVSAALLFEDRGQASQTMQSLSALTHIEYGVLYDSLGHEFAKYRRDEGSDATPPPVQADGLVFTRKALQLFHTVDFDGETLGTVFIRADLAQMWARFRHYALILFTVMGVAALAAVMLSQRLRNAIANPLIELASTANVVAKDRNYSVRALKRRNDEIGTLIDAFNEMLDQIQARDFALEEARNTLEKRVAQRTQELQEAHKQLLATSRQAGMAEVATSVLHNVGNVLNSVNTSAHLLMDQLRGSQIEGVSRLAGLINDHRHELADFLTRDERGTRVIEYLESLARHLKGERERQLQELQNLVKNVEHIKEIVAMQQTYARVSGLQEELPVTELVEDALSMAESSFARHHVEVTRHYAANLPVICVDKHKVLQILVNLFRNAKHACEESSESDKRIDVLIEHRDARIRVTVRDNGIGIPRENLTRIFSHGFTTRASGHGFGLHSSALAAVELQGSLTAHSDGPGTGATFVLELPIRKSEAQREEQPKDRPRLAAGA